VIGGTLLGIANSCLYVVYPGTRVVMLDRSKGVLPGSIGEGLHFKIPYLHVPFTYDVRTRFSNINSTSGSKDLQTVDLTMRVLYKPDELKLNEIHTKLGPDYSNKVMPIGNEILKSVIAQYDAEQLITQREVVSKLIAESLIQRARNFNIIVEDVALTHITFSAEFTKAIEEKQVAQQEAERSKFIVMRDQQEQKAVIIRAQGEAEAAKLIHDAMQGGNGFVQLRRIEASKEIAETLSENPNISYLPKSGNILLSPRQNKY